MYRRKTFDDKLSRKLKQPSFAKSYILASIKKGMSVMEALKDIISCMGTKEFSEISGIKSPNISRMLSQDAIPKLATLQKFLDPFQLEVDLNIRPRRKKASSKKKSKKTTSKPKKKAKSTPKKKSTKKKRR